MFYLGFKQALRYILSLFKCYSFNSTKEYFYHEIVIKLNMIV